MPWKIDGTFERVNPDYTASTDGALWQKDLESNPSIKIVASRHDWHDQDLGQGIQQCINTSGYNQMNAALNLGNNKMINVGVGSLVNDGVNFGQIAGGINYDDGTSTLTLSDRNGDPIDTTIIVATGGGGGSVTSISGVANQIVTSPAPLTTTGSIGLAQSGVIAGAYATPSSIQVDEFGRITQILAGSGGGGIGEAPVDGKDYVRKNAAWSELPTYPVDQTLSISQVTATWNSVTISGGNTIQLQSASPSVGGSGGSAGLLRSTDKEKLNNLPDAADAPDLTANNTWTGRNDFNGSVFVQVGDFHAWDVKSEMGSTQVGLFSKGLRVLADGSIQLPNLPVSADGSGLTSGTLYRDASDFVKIA